MPLRYAFKIVFFFIPLFISGATVYAQKDAIEGLWYNQEKTAKIEIYKALDGKFYGKIGWLKVPTVDGHVKVDINNPDKARRNQTFMGLLILRGFKKLNAKEYEDGTIYDPKNGKTYSCILTIKGDKLDVRGYYGFSFIGRSTVWTRAEQ